MSNFRGLTAAASLKPRGNLEIRPARLHFRGHPNRTLRLASVDEGELPEYDAELVLDGKAVGRITSAAPDRERGIVALAYVRREVPAGAMLELRDGRSARLLGDPV